MVDHLLATRLRSRPPPTSTSIGLVNRTITGDTPALLAVLVPLVLLVRRLEDGN